MGVLETLFLIVTIVFSCLVILLSVLFSKSLRDALDHADRIHERSRQHLDKTLDRLMAVDFQSFKAAQWTENAPQGGYEEPYVATADHLEVATLPGLERR
jgi:hypothetical protein